MATQKEPSPEALANVTEENIGSRAELLPEEAELRGSGVRSLAVNPGPVPTEWPRVAGWNQITRKPGTIGAPQVVRESLAAYDRGAGSIVPGALFRWAMRASALGPRALRDSRRDSSRGR